MVGEGRGGKKAKEIVPEVLLSQPIKHRNIKKIEKIALG